MLLANISLNDGNLSNTDFCLCVLKTFLNDIEQSSRWNYRAIDVGVTDVALNSKSVCSMRKAFNAMRLLKCYK